MKKGKWTHWPTKSEIMEDLFGYNEIKKTMRSFKQHFKTEYEFILRTARVTGPLPFHPETLINFCSNAKRKFKHGVWSTPKESDELHGKGLYSGHHIILTNLGYPFEL